jgi:hypothetical protein
LQTTGSTLWCKSNQFRLMLPIQIESIKIWWNSMGYRFESMCCVMKQCESWSWSCVTSLWVNTSSSESNILQFYPVFWQSQCHWVEISRTSARSSNSLYFLSLSFTFGFHLPWLSTNSFHFLSLPFTSSNCFHFLSLFHTFITNEPTLARCEVHDLSTPGFL